MAYFHDPRPFVSEPAQPFPYPPATIPYPTYQQQLPREHYYQAYGPADYADFGYHGYMGDEYDDGEMSTRPRLTREQVDVLEGQFQAHPKPNSMVKKQLAKQTRLSLPRVAVCCVCGSYKWFADSL